MAVGRVVTVWALKWLADDFFLCNWQLQQNGQPFVCGLLMLCGAADGYIGVSCSQSGGKQAAARNKRLVIIKKCKSERKRIIAQISGRQSSAAAKKKSELRQV